MSSQPARQAEVWIKTTLMAHLVPHGARVLDLTNGAGSLSGNLDFDRWTSSGVGITELTVCAADAAYLQFAKSRMAAAERPYKVTFEHSDVLTTACADDAPEVDTVRCHGGLTGAFGSYEELSSLLSQTRRLKPGGLFYGYTIDAASVWSRAQKELMEPGRRNAMPDFARGLIRCQFRSKIFSEFGTRFEFTAKGLETQKGSLVHLASLIECAEGRFDLELIDATNAADFFDEWRQVYTEQIRKLVPGYAKHMRLPPEQHEILRFYTIFVFRRKESA